MTRKYFRDEKRDELILILLAEGWDQSQIARKLRKTPQRINQLVKRLSSEGRCILHMKRGKPNDKRRTDN